MKPLLTTARPSRDVDFLCRKIGGVSPPVVVPVRSRDSRILNECFTDVRLQVEEHGGSAQLGWTIWEWPGIFLEAEFHAVWRSPSGELVDVSPKADGETTILFAADSQRIYTGQKIDTVYFPIGTDPRIRELISVAQKFRALHREGEEASPIKGISMVSAEAEVFQRRWHSLQTELMNSREARRAARLRQSQKPPCPNRLEP